METIRGYEWGYQVEKGHLRLYAVETSTGLWDSPAVAVTNGIKFEYYTGKKVFLTAAGATDDASPDEDSYLNIPESYIPAVLEFLKSKFASDPKMAEYHKMESDRLWNIAEDRYEGWIKVAIPVSPYAIK